MGRVLYMCIYPESPLTYLAPFVEYRLCTEYEKTDYRASVARAQVTAYLVVLHLNKHECACCLLTLTW